MNNYCPSCYRLFESEKKRCPHCRKKLREPAGGDVCRMDDSLASPWDRIFEDVLRDNDIPFYTCNDDEGVGSLVAILGYVHEFRTFFVPYSKLERANELYDELFSGIRQEQDEKSVFFDDDDDEEEEYKRRSENEPEDK